MERRTTLRRGRNGALGGSGQVFGGVRCGTTLGGNSFADGCGSTPPSASPQIFTNLVGTLMCLLFEWCSQSHLRCAYSKCRALAKHRFRKRRILFGLRMPPNWVPASSRDTVSWRNTTRAGTHGRCSGPDPIVLPAKERKQIRVEFSEATAGISQATAPPLFSRVRTS
jgi:hypothetical protein